MFARSASGGVSEHASAAAGIEKNYIGVLSDMQIP
jgi:hypothetical protein